MDESLWQVEKAGFKEKIAGFEKTNEINAALKAENSALTEEVARLKSVLQKTSHTFEIKLRDSSISSERRLAERISAEAEATERPRPGFSQLSMVSIVRFETFRNNLKMRRKF